MKPNAIIDHAAVRETLKLLIPSGAVTEIRIVEGTGFNDRYLRTWSGYFDNADDVPDQLDRLSGWTGAYFVPNEINPALLARAVNRIRPIVKEPTTSDADVTARRFMLVDVDSVRPKGISSTNEEHDCAVRIVQAIAEDLQLEGWPTPVIADSGNGGHLLYPVTLPADDKTLVKRCLEALAKRYPSASAKVDTSVFNPARIWKLYGTFARKGDNTTARPHRMSRIISAPPILDAVSIELLEELAGPVPEPPKAPTRQPARTNGTKRFETFEHDVASVRSYLERHGVSVVGEKSSNDAVYLHLESCPVNPSIQRENGSDISVIVNNSGKISYKNMHERGRDFNWVDVRDALEPGYKAFAQSSREPQRKYRPAQLATSDVQEPVTPAKPASAGAVSDVLNYVNGVKDGKIYNVPWPWQQLTQMTQALLPGSITMICADPGAGKTFMLREGVQYWIANGYDCRAFFLEKERLFYTRRLIAQLQADGHYVDIDWVKSHAAEYEAAVMSHEYLIEEVGKCIDVPDGSRITLDTLIAWIRQHCSAGKRVLVIDPVSAAAAGAERWMKDEDFMLEAQNILNAHGSSLVLTNHPSKASYKGGSSGFTMGGGSAYFRFADVTMWIKRCKPPRNVRYKSPCGESTREAATFIEMHKTREARGTAEEIAYSFGHDLRLVEHGLVTGREA